MSAAVNTGPYHEDFSWLVDSVKHDIDARFAAQVRDVATGCRTIGSITQQYLLDCAAGERTLLSEGAMHSLVALISPLMDMLDNAAHSQITYRETLVAEGSKK